MSYRKNNLIFTAMETTKIISWTTLIVIILIMLAVSNFKAKKGDEPIKSIKLLPHRIKYLGAAVAVLSFIIIQGSDYALFRDIGPFGETFLSIGLLLVVMTRERHEDEMMITLRLNSFFFAVIVGVLSQLLFRTLDIVIAGRQSDFTPYAVINPTLMIYLLYFHLAKKKALK